MFFALLIRICLLSPASFFFQAEDGIRDLVRSRGLGDVYKRQLLNAEKRIDAYVVESENFESIHNHSAYALIERNKLEI